MKSKSIYGIVAAVIVVAVVAIGVYAFATLGNPNQPPASTPTPTPTVTPTPTPTPTPTTTPTQNQTLTTGFENGLGNWTGDAHLPQEVDWNVTTVANVSSTGNHSALLYMDGRHDDGTVWIEQKLHLDANATKNVTVTFDFWSESESFNTLAAVVGFVGDKNPSQEGDFQVLGAANEVEGWKSYSISSEVETDASGDIYVALGFSVRWETNLTYNIDNIVITVS